MIEWNLNWLRFRCLMLASRSDSKHDKICDTDTTIRRGKVLIFKSKALSFCTTNFSYISTLPSKIEQIFCFWVVQSTELSRNTCCRRFKSSLVVNSHVAKTERLALSKMWTSTFCWQRLLVNHLVAFEYNFRSLNLFPSKLPPKLRSVFLCKLTFLKIQLFVTRIKWLI